MGIYVWGIGCGASELIDQGLAPGRITAFVDSFAEARVFQGRPVISPQELNVSDCELLIVTTRHARAVEEICLTLGVPTDRILYLKNNYSLADRNASCTIAREILGQPLLRALLPVQHIVPTPSQLNSQVLPDNELNNDYVRLATLELLCRRLKSVPGDAAELGVYRGHFAKCINMLLPERTLYLFDSFSGFSSDAAASAAFQEAHTNTAAEKVLSVLPFPDQAVVKAGFFPQSLDGLETQFCLVSLDVDFYQTTLEGLRYFWPRLSPGGYLLLHDWGSPKLTGVSKALADYQAEIGGLLPSVPLCDIGGSLVLCK